MADPLSQANPRLAIAATFTVEPILPGLQISLREAGLELDVQFASYHQVFQQLLSSYKPTRYKPESGATSLLCAWRTPYAMFLKMSRKPPRSSDA